MRLLCADGRGKIAEVELVYVSIWAVAGRYFFAKLIVDFVGSQVMGVGYCGYSRFIDI